MIRRRHKLQVSTFPFLAVLLCAMGSLILVLLIFDRRAQTAARDRVARKAAEQQRSADEALNARAREEQDRLAAWQTQQDKARADAAAEQSRVHDSLLGQQRQLQEHRADVVRQQAAAAATLRAEEDRAAELRRQVAAERDRLLAEEKTLTTRKSQVAQNAATRKEAKAGLAQATADLANLEETVKAIKAAREREATTFSVIPYRGKHGDSRRPLYVECTARGLIFHPDKLKVVFPISPEIADQQSLSDSLTKARDEVLRRVAQQRAKSPPGTEAAAGYLLFLVRPDGISSYNLTQAALRGQSIDFGYEFVEADWVLDFPADGQSATQPWMTARADNSSTLTTPGPHPATGGQASGTGQPGVAQRQGGTGANGGVSGSTVSTIPSTTPGSQGTAGVSTYAGGPATGAPGSQGTGLGTPRYQAVTLTGPQGSNGSGFGVRGPGLGSSGSEGTSAAGTPGLVGANGSAGIGQPNGIAGPGLTANGPPATVVGSADGSSGQSGTKGPGGSAPAAGPGQGRVDGSPAVANSGPAVPNTDGAMPRQPPATIGPPTTRTPEVFARDVPTPPSMRTSAANDPTNVAQAANSPIQAPPILAPLPGQSTQPAGSPGNGGTSRTAANGQVAQAPPPNAGQQSGAGGTGGHGEPGTTGSPSGGTGGSEDGTGLSMSAPPLPVTPPPTPRKAGVQTPRPVRLAGEKEWVLYVECKADGVVLHPSLRSFSAASLAQPQGRADLTRAAQMLLDRRLNTANQLGEKTFKVQVRFLVWPDGQRTYHGVYPALDSLPAPKTMQILNNDDDVERLTSS